jgi:hypothetical protein
LAIRLVNMAMSQSAQPAFKVSCPECGVEHKSEHYDMASRFLDKHAEHTGHQMEWVRGDFEVDVEPFLVWGVQCETCADSWEFFDEDEAQEFQEEHAEYTDHEIDGEPVSTEFEVDADASDDRRMSQRIRVVTEKLEDKFDYGVPLEAVLMAFVDKRDRMQARHEIDQLKQKGEIYEPKTGHICTT